jgi:hypothetical protein
METVIDERIIVECVCGFSQDFRPLDWPEEEETEEPEEPQITVADAQYGDEPTGVEYDDN